MTTANKPSWLDEYKALHPEAQPLILPERFKNATFEGIPDGKLKQTTEQYILRFGTELAPNGIGCLFLGRAGTYKTYSSAVIAKAVVKTHKTDALFVQVPLFVSRTERRRFDKQTDQIIRDMCRVPFLVMDDFSQIIPNSFGAGLMLEIIEDRFSNLRPTLWTGNMEIPNIREGAASIVHAISSNYGPSFGRRIVETTKGYGVYIT